MVQDYNDPSQEESHNKNHHLHITFHNPNTVEETVKYLAKEVAKTLVEQEVIRKQTIDDDRKRQTR